MEVETLLLIDANCETEIARHRVVVGPLLRILRVGPLIV